MVKFVGIQEQIRNNNRKSVFLLLAFPLLILVSLFAIIYFLNVDQYQNYNLDLTIDRFLQAVPFVLVFVLIWFVIAYFGHSKMIAMATGAKTLERRNNMRVYNLVENLCMSVGMQMPKVQIIESNALNTYASGLNQSNYTVTLTRGIIEKLDDDELEGVIAHELMHIRNNDVRLLVVSIIFVGIFAFVVEVAFRNVLYGGGRRRDKNSGNIMIVVLIVSLVAYFFSLLFKFSLSRSREYMADSGAAEMTRKPWALASALRKISNNHQVEEVKNSEVKQMFIENRSNGLMGLFTTHPPIDKRINFLEQF